MSTTQPIRNTEQLKKLECYYDGATPLSERNRLLILMGLNTALRITDMLKLKWDSVYDFAAQKPKRHIELIEQKTGKHTMIALNTTLSNALFHWMQTRCPDSQDYIFESTRTKNPIDRHQAYRIVHRAAVECGLPSHISCHSLRKTFGYHAWKMGVQPAILMNIYNHSSYRITKRYLCIDQDDKDEVFYQVQL